MLLGDLPHWPLVPLIGVPAFAVAYLLPAHSRRHAQLTLAGVAAVIGVAAALIVALYLIAESQCPPDAYECPL